MPQNPKDRLMTISARTADDRVRTDDETAASDAAGRGTRDEARDLAATLAGRPSAARRRAPPAGTRRSRGEGQWALGYREPLHAHEESKKNQDGLNVRH